VLSESMTQLPLYWSTRLHVGLGNRHRLASPVAQPLVRQPGKPYSGVCVQPP